MRLGTTARPLRIAALASSIALVLGAGAYGAGPAASATSARQWGLNTYVVDHCESSATWLKDARNQMAGFRSLRANSVGIAFPLYTGTSLSSNDIHTGLQCAGKEHTPPAARIAVVVRAAHAVGLKVLLRPLIDEASLSGTPHAWRGVIHPSNQKLWFANYFKAIKPYLQMAASTKAERFAVASELNSLAHNAGWKGVFAQVRAVYHGSLSFATNWAADKTAVKWSGVSSDLDTYIGVAAYPSATPAQLLAGWNAFLKAHTLPYAISAATIDEVGIPAQDGAYPTPWYFSFPLASHPFDQAIQANWFAMVCSFVKTHAMRGVYFWGPFMNNRQGQLLSAPDLSYPQDIQPMTQAVIKACFS